MTSVHLTVPLAFFAGFLSFVSPCVLPLVPVYLGYLTGSVVAEDVTLPRRVALAHAACFVAGFSLVFVLIFGLPLGLLGRAVGRMIPILVKVGGALMILFGLHTTGLVRIPVLGLEGHARWEAGNDPSYLRSLFFGSTFAAGWTPCVGPLLGAILTLALDTQSLGKALLLLTSYSLGLGIPFLVVALMLTTMVGRVHRWGRYLRLVSWVSGAFLVLVGLLLVTGMFQQLSAVLSGLAPEWLWERL